MDSLQKVNQRLSAKVAGRTLSDLSLHEFSETVFGFKNSWHHLEVYEALNTWRKLLVLLPRLHAKTVMITQVYPGLLLANNPEWRIIIASNRFDKAVGSVLVVKTVLERLGFRPSQTDMEGQWTQNKLFLKRSYLSRDASLGAVSSSTEDVGDHADIILFDDLVTDKTIRTKLRRERLRRWFSDVLVNILEPDGQLVGTGNYWHYDDLYTTFKEAGKEPEITVFDDILEQEYDTNLGAGWKKIIYPAVLDWDKKTVLWDGKWTWELLLKRRAGLTGNSWEVQFMNNPTATRGQHFDTDWIQYMPIENFPADVKRIQAWDFARSTGSRTDFTVCNTVDMDKKGFFYFRDVFRKRLQPHEKMEAIKQQYFKHRPSRIVTEKSFLDDIVQLMRLIPGVPPIEPVSIPRFGTEEGVKTRIENLETWYKGGKITHPEEAQWQPYFDEEYINFPNARNDDILDALELAIRVLSEGSLFEPTLLNVTL